MGLLSVQPTFDPTVDIYGTFLKLKGKKRNSTRLTCNSRHRSRLLPSDKEDDVSLRRIGVIIFQEEGLVHAILLQRRKLDQQIQRPCKRLLKDEVLFPSYLRKLARVVAVGDDITLHPRAKGADPDELSQLCLRH